LTLAGRLQLALIAPPTGGIGALGLAEHMREMRLIAKTAFGADLRESHFRVFDELLGLLNALIANPFLWGHAGTAFE
jgi:hypothetical protein